MNESLSSKSIVYCLLSTVFILNYPLSIILSTVYCLSPSTMPFPSCIKNGELIPIAEAVLPVTHIEFAYGFGVYENIRVVRGEARFLDEHIERLFKSATSIGLEHSLRKNELEDWTKNLINTLGADAINLKVLLIGGRTPADATLFILPLSPLFPEKKLFTKGASAITVSYERSFPQAKTLSMLGSYLAYRKARSQNAYDALLVNREGCITEGTRTNFLALRGRTLISPPRHDILEGVTLRHVIAVAEEQGLSVMYDRIPLDTITMYDGLFLTSTSSKIMPLSSVDDHPIPLPDTLRELMRAFDLVS